MAWNAFQGHLDGCPISLGLRSCFKYASKVLPGSRSLEYKPLQREAVLCLPQPVVLVPRGSGACFCELLGALPPDSVDTEVGSLRGVEGGSGRLPPHRAGTLWRCPHRGWERRGRLWGPLGHPRLAGDDLQGLPAWGWRAQPSPQRHCAGSAPGRQAALADPPGFRRPERGRLQGPVSGLHRGALLLSTMAPAAGTL